MFWLKLFYVLSIQICGICFICAIFSISEKMKNEFQDKYDIYTELIKKDIGEKVIILTQIMFMCIIPIFNTILSIGFLWKWEEIRNSAYEKQRKTMIDYISKHPDKFYPHVFNKNK